MGYLDLPADTDAAFPIDAAEPAPPPSTLSELARIDRCNLYWFIYRRVRDATEAEELTQETFAEAVRSLDRFSGRSALRTWVYGIAANLISAHFRRSPNRRFSFDSEEMLEQVAQENADPLDRLIATQLLSRVLQHVEDLPEAMRVTLFMVFLDEIPYEQVAATLQVPIGTIRSRISRARSLLRERLRAEGVPAIGTSHEIQRGAMANVRLD